MFIYTPLQQAYAGRYEVPFGDTWPQYNSSFVRQYVPMPVVTNLPSGPTFTTQERTGDNWYGYAQMLCNGWPLYYVENLNQGNKTIQPAMFEPATPTMTPPTGQTTEMNSTDDDGGEGWPPNLWGP